MINYSVYMLPNPLDATAPAKAYARAQVKEVMSFRAFVQHIADHGGHTRGKVKGIMADMCECLVEMLLEGKKAGEGVVDLESAKKKGGLNGGDDNPDGGGTTPGGGSGNSGQQNQNAVKFTISAVPNNSAFGSVSGGGEYSVGSRINLVASAKSGYKFSQWQDGNTSASRTVTVSKDETFTATFVEDAGGAGNSSSTGNDDTSSVPEY